MHVRTRLAKYVKTNMCHFSGCGPCEHISLIVTDSNDANNLLNILAIYFSFDMLYHFSGKYLILEDEVRLSKGI